MSKSYLFYHFFAKIFKIFLIKYLQKNCSFLLLSSPLFATLLSVLLGDLS